MNPTAKGNGKKNWEINPTFKEAEPRANQPSGCRGFSASAKFLSDIKDRRLLHK
jgi:hypothetical protein